MFGNMKTHTTMYKASFLSLVYPLRRDVRRLDVRGDFTPRPSVNCSVTVEAGRFAALREEEEEEDDDDDGKGVDTAVRRRPSCRSGPGPGSG